MFFNQHQDRSFAENAKGFNCPSLSNHPTSWAEDEDEMSRGQSATIGDVGDALDTQDEDIHYNQKLHPATN